MTIIVLKTNVLQLTDVLVRDLGFLVPASEGTVTFTDVGNFADIKTSRNVRTLATDNAFGAGSSTLIFNDGTNDVDQSLVDTFLDGIGSVDAIFMAIGGSLQAAGTLPVVNLGSDLAMVNRTFTQMRGRRGVPGTLATTTVQLELDGSPVLGATLSWTSADVAFTLKSVAINISVIPGTRLSLRLTAVESGNPEDIYVEVN